MLHANYFADNASCTRKEFWCCFRMSKEMFMTIRDEGVQFLLRDEGAVVVSKLFQCYQNSFGDTLELT
jgi:hypothetical protein